MPKASLKKSNKKDKKWMVKIDDKTIHFGGAGYSDYTKHRDPDRKKRYLKRHRKREDWTNPKTAGFWSRWLLWGEPSLEASIKAIYNRFGIKIIKM